MVSHFLSRDRCLWSHKNGELSPLFFIADQADNPFHPLVVLDPGVLSQPLLISMAVRRGEFPGIGWALNRSILKEFRDRVATLNMGLEDRLDTEIGGLSGGQRQALTLLMATWKRPSLLLLDEHTAALDPRSADRIIHLTREIISREGLTTLMVTHSFLPAFIDKVISKITISLDTQKRPPYTSTLKSKGLSKK
jgi:ABC-type dipeptide/oligopeptide/nickel transport system ATPase subunit